MYISNKMNKLKNSKYKNTGIIFELLIRQITNDTISGKDSLAVNVIKKYFSKGEIQKEHQLYQSLINSKDLNESKSNIIIDNVINLSKRLNKTQLRKEKYNLIKEIKDNYDIEIFFKNKINNYPQYAAAYILMESANSNEFTDPNLLINNRNTLLEHISSKDLNLSNDIYDDYLKLTADMRILTYRTLLEKFNDKYVNLNNQQKLVLKEYINNMNNVVNLREFVNSNYKNLKFELSKLLNKVDDKTSLIKLTEVINLLKPLEKTETVKDENIISLLQYYQLIEEVKQL